MKFHRKYKNNESHFKGYIWCLKEYEFITGLSYYTTEEGLSEAFSQYGQVIEGTLKTFTNYHYLLRIPPQSSQMSPCLMSKLFVLAATIVMDRVSDRSKGFGFVSYASEHEAEKAITEMDGKVALCSFSFRISL